MILGARTKAVLSVIAAWAIIIFGAICPTTFIGLGLLGLGIAFTVLIYGLAKAVFDVS